MAWYDTVADYASVAMPVWGVGIQAGKALGNYAAGKDVKLFGADTSYTPPGAPAPVSQTTTLTPAQQAAFSPMSNPAISGAFNPFQTPEFNAAHSAAGAYGVAGAANQADADRALMGGFRAPTFQAPVGVRPGTVNANTSSSGAGVDRAAGYLSDASAARGNQQSVYNTAIDWANGGMPSVGQDIANEAGVRANEQFLRAGSEANQSYGGAAASAAQAYQDALAQQTFATQQAGRTAARQVGDSASDAVLRQAALTSGARGGNIGMGLRAGLQGAAMQSADANRQGARLMNDANSAASFNAAAGQRAAQNAALMSNLATQGTQERAGFAASAAEQEARLRAAQIGSQEQQNMLGVAAGAADSLRSADIGTANAATGLAGVGLGMDQLITGTNQNNADRAFAADQFNQGMGLNYDQLNAGQGLAYDQLNSGNYNQVANRGAGAAQFGIGTQASMAGQATQAQQQLAMQQIMGNQQLATLFASLDESAKGRMLDAYIAEQGQATTRRGQNIGLFGGGTSALGAVGAAAAMSDRRGKKNIKPTKSPDFRKAGSYSYEYKNLKAQGTAPGKHLGPMAQELPDDVVRKGDDGLLRVDIGRLALALASSVGELQRKVEAA